MTPCPPCVDSKHPRVYVQNVSVSTGTTRTCFNTCAPWCRHTRGRFECTHGGVFEATHGFFPRFFSVPQVTDTHTHTPNTHHDHATTHTTQHHTETERETDRNRERQRKRDREDETRQEGKEKMKEGDSRQEKIERREEGRREERRSKTSEETR